MSRLLLNGRRSPEETAAALLSPLILAAVGLWGVGGLLVAVFVVAALAMAWADQAQMRAGDAWSPCRCRVDDPDRMTASMARRRYRAAILLAGLAVGFVLLGGVWRWPVSVLAAWSAAATAAAVPLRYGGCPELGLLASLLVRRRARSGCGPWCWADRRAGDL